MEGRLLCSPVSTGLGFSKNICGPQSVALPCNPCTGKRQCNSICRSSYDPNDPVNRRELLLGSSIGAAGLPFLLNNPSAFGSPIQPPDLKDCKKSSGNSNVDCCLPVPNKAIKDFVRPENPQLRTRPAAHLADPAYAEKYSKAYELLRALPDDDPRKQINQAYIHCVFCDSRLVQPGTQNAFDVHFSWIFLPWHRWYLYFHERILQNLLKDPTFSLPFWNWDNQSVVSPLPNSMPAFYINKPSLFDAKRNTLHQPPAIADLSWFPGDLERQNDLATLRKTNDSVMYQQVVSSAKTASLFMGQKYTAESEKTPGGGTLENHSHGFVHVWTGGNNAPYEDMGALYSAGIDPIFFAHHGNIDRIWWIWKKKLGRKEFKDKDWLNSAFVFFDEFGDPVKVKVRDALEIHKLGYRYQDVPITWLNAKSTTSAADTSSSTKSKLKGKKVTVPEFGNISAGKSKNLEAPFSAKVKIPAAKLVSFLGSGNAAAAAEAVAESEGSETVLVIQGIEFPMDQAVAFDIFINLPTADSSTSLDCKEYAGSYIYLPHMAPGKGGTDSTTVRLGVGETLEDLGIKGGDSFDVTLVPRNGGDKIVIKGFDVEFDDL